MSAAWKDESRKHWHTAGDHKPNDQQIAVGCLQRIADATEVMSRRHEELLSDNERMRNQVKRLQRRLDTEERRSAALRGVINRMKRKVEGPAA